MLTAIMAMFEMAAGITSQQMVRPSGKDPYFDSGVGGIDQTALDLAVNKLNGWPKSDPVSLCERVKKLIDDDPQRFALLRSEVGKDKFSYRDSFVPSDPRLVSPWLRGCEVSAPVAGDGVSRHRLVIAPVMVGSGGILVPADPHRYTVWTCVTRTSCMHEEAV